VLALDWSDEARADLRGIGSYISQYNPSAAIRVIEKIFSGAELLTFMPLAFRQGRVAGTREYPVHPSYLLVYEVNPTKITILRIMHTKRQYP